MSNPVFQDEEHSEDDQAMNSSGGGVGDKKPEPSTNKPKVECKEEQSSTLLQMTVTSVSQVAATDIPVATEAQVHLQGRNNLEGDTTGTNLASVDDDQEPSNKRTKRTSSEQSIKEEEILLSKQTSPLNPGADFADMLQPEVMPELKYVEPAVVQQAPELEAGPSELLPPFSYHMSQEYPSTSAYGYTHKGEFALEEALAAALCSPAPATQPQPQAEEPPPLDPKACYYELEVGFDLKRYEDAGEHLISNPPSVEYSDNGAALQSELFELGQRGFVEPDPVDPSAVAMPNDYSSPDMVQEPPIGEPAAVSVDVPSAYISVGEQGLLMGEPATVAVEVPTAYISVGEQGLSMGDPAAIAVEVPTAYISVGEQGLSMGEPAAVAVEVPTAYISVGEQGLSMGDPAAIAVEVPTAYISVGEQGFSMGEPAAVAVEVSTAYISVGEQSLSMREPVTVGIEVPTAYISVGEQGLSTGEPSAVAVEVSTANNSVGEQGLSMGEQSAVTVEVPTAYISFGEQGFSMGEPVAVSVEVPTAYISVGEQGLSTGEPSAVAVQMPPAYISGILSPAMSEPVASMALPEDQVAGPSRPQRAHAVQLYQRGGVGEPYTCFITSFPKVNLEPTWSDEGVVGQAPMQAQGQTEPLFAAAHSASAHLLEELLGPEGEDEGEVQPAPASLLPQWNLLGSSSDMGKRPDTIAEALRNAAISFTAIDIEDALAHAREREEATFTSNEPTVDVIGAAAAVIDAIAGDTNAESVIPVSAEMESTAVDTITYSVVAAAAAADDTIVAIDTATSTKPVAVEAADSDATVAAADAPLENVTAAAEAVGDDTATLVKAAATHSPAIPIETAAAAIEEPLASGSSKSRKSAAKAPKKAAAKKVKKYTLVENKTTTMVLRKRTQDL